MTFEAPQCGHSQEFFCDGVRYKLSTDLSGVTALTYWRNGTAFHRVIQSSLTETVYKIMLESLVDEVHDL